MIALLSGQVHSLHADRAVIDVGGVGYLVTITPSTALHLAMGATTSLHTSLVVREDSMTLYGFLEESSRNLFESVQTVSGIGPKVALSIVGSLSPDDLARAVAQEDVALIEKVPGIGRKGAQRLILELKGKLSDMGSAKKVHVEPWREQLVSALTSLGFSSKEADASINSFMKSYEGDISGAEVSELLKGVLAQGRRR